MYGTRKIHTIYQKLQPKRNVVEWFKFRKKIPAIFSLQIQLLLMLTFLITGSTWRNLSSKTHKNLRNWRKFLLLRSRTVWIWTNVIKTHLKASATENDQCSKILLPLADLGTRILEAKSLLLDQRCIKVPSIRANWWVIHPMSTVTEIMIKMCYLNQASTLSQVLLLLMLPKPQEMRWK